MSKRRRFDQRYKLFLPRLSLTSDLSPLSSIICHLHYTSHSFFIFLPSMLFACLSPSKVSLAAFQVRERCSS